MQVSIKVIEKRGIMFIRKNLIRAMKDAVDGKTFTYEDSENLEQFVRNLIPGGSHKHIGSIVFKHNENTIDISKPLEGITELECIVTTD